VGQVFISLARMLFAGAALDASSSSSISLMSGVIVSFFASPALPGAAKRKKQRRDFVKNSVVIL